MVCETTLQRKRIRVWQCDANRPAAVTNRASIRKGFGGKEWLSFSAAIEAIVTVVAVGPVHPRHCQHKDALAKSREKFLQLQCICCTADCRETRLARTVTVCAPFSGASPNQKPQSRSSYQRETLEVKPCAAHSARLMPLKSDLLRGCPGLAFQAEPRFKTRSQFHLYTLNPKP